MKKQEKKEALTNQERLDNLIQQKAECEILYHKLLGAIEVLQAVIGDENEKRD